MAQGRHRPARRVRLVEQPAEVGVAREVGHGGVAAGEVHGVVIAGPYVGQGERGGQLVGDAVEVGTEPPGVGLRHAAALVEAEGVDGGAYAAGGGDRHLGVGGGQHLVRGGDLLGPVAGGVGGAVGQPHAVRARDDHQDLLRHGSSVHQGFAPCIHRAISRVMARNSTRNLDGFKV